MIRRVTAYSIMVFISRKLPHIIIITASRIPMPPGAPGVIKPTIQENRYVPRNSPSLSPGTSNRNAAGMAYIAVEMMYCTTYSRNTPSTRSRIFRFSSFRYFSK